MFHKSCNENAFFPWTIFWCFPKITFSFECHITNQAINNYLSIFIKNQFLMFSEITFSFECHITNHAMKILIYIMNFFLDAFPNYIFFWMSYHKSCIGNSFLHHELFYDVSTSYNFFWISYHKSRNEFFYFRHEPFVDVFSNYNPLRISYHKSCNENCFFFPFSSWTVFWWFPKLHVLSKVKSQIMKWNFFISIFIMNRFLKFFQITFRWECHITNYVMKIFFHANENSFDFSFDLWNCFRWNCFFWNQTLWNIQAIILVLVSWWILEAKPFL